MTTMDAVTLIEDGGDDIEFEDILAAWQHLHDSGDAYQLQGWYGREAQRLLQQGLIS